MQPSDRFAPGRGGHHQLVRREAVQTFVCHSCGHVFGAEDGDPRQLPLFAECQNECLVTAALVCADRPTDREDDDDGDDGDNGLEPGPRRAPF